MYQIYDQMILQKNYHKCYEKVSLEVFSFMINQVHGLVNQKIKSLSLTMVSMNNYKPTHIFNMEIYGSSTKVLIKGFPL